MAPFDTNDLLTCWIPLEAVPAVDEGGSSLLFATGSHRDFALPYWYEIDGKDLEGRYPIASCGPFEVGDCSFHHGWTLHSAPANGLPTTRYAYAVTYVKDGVTTLSRDEDQVRFPDVEDVQSYNGWIEDVGWGAVARHPDLPLVYEAQSN